MTSSDMRTAPMNFMSFTGDNHRRASWSSMAELNESLATKNKKKMLNSTPNMKKLQRFIAAKPNR